ncbi:type IV pilus assembly protein PilM [Granulicella rosea]|uniref:Type IV pilus assembly protein PilM n=1 Tax=Granulicella rosea TaxID=474952 RepID=A0A239L4R9_9BACT|nr:hypothetical protein [Granulicella rosea]SNT24689.1 type IV pilus assembly protein PilM [Granulicella rosea]
MDLLPKALGTRPRLAVEIRPEGVIAARAEDAAAVLTAVSQGLLSQGAVAPGLRHGNIVNRAATVAAVKKALEAVTLRERETSVVIPDTAVRVLLLDFDSLPAKAVEALPVVRFRLKKLLPFDADDAMVSYQVMSTTKNMVRVLAVAVPREVLAEYESIVREAGFEPGAVLPSTLASLSGLEQIDGPTLVVNVGETSVTTAIVQAGVLLLHRTVDLTAEGIVEVKPAEVQPSFEVPAELLALPLVDPDDSAGEWAMQKPVTGYGVLDDEHISAEAEMQARLLQEQLERELAEELEREAIAQTVLPAFAREMGAKEPERMTAAAREVTQAVNVAVAYFEDTLHTHPETVMAAGTMGAGVLRELMHESGWASLGDVRNMQVNEMVELAMLAGGASTTRAPQGWLAGVRGALRS